MPSLVERFKSSWNAFFNNKDPSYGQIRGYSTSYRPDRIRLTPGNEKSIITAIYNRIAMDVAAVDIEHVRVDEEDRYLETIKSDLNTCLTLSANLDQTGRSFIQDAVMSMFDEGCVALVPTDTSGNPKNSPSYDIYSIRVGEILEWFPADVRVRVYNEQNGKKEDIILPKSMVAIVENPFYSIMNEPNSTVRRLSRKLALLDVIDEQVGSGKMDLIIQLPYIIKTEQRRQQAEQRRKDIEMQLAGSKYGIAYTDGTERITQLNRPLENNLMSQIEYLIKLAYSQLGMTEEVLNGTANEETMLNYFNRTVEPILAALCLEMRRKWFTKTAITQGHSIHYFKDPFKLVTLSAIAEAGETFTRNEVLTPNEVRGIIGLKPSEQQGADELKNRNLYQEGNTPQEESSDIPGANISEADMDNMSEEELQSLLDELDEYDAKLDELEEEANNA